MAISEQERIGKFHAPLGTDKLNLVRFIGTEYVNDLFDFRVEAADVDGNIDFNALLGEKGTVEIVGYDGKSRFYNGIITEVAHGGHDVVAHTYAIQMRPWLWLLSLAENNRVFHEKTVEQVIDEVFGDYSAAEVEKKLTKTYETLEYTVQFCETDLSFVFRMLERHGINYFFKHENGKHTLVLSDDNGGFEKIEKGSRELNYVGLGHSATDEHFWAWSNERQVTTGKMKLTDYNFKKPNAGMVASDDASLTHSEGSHEVYHYPGLYLDQGQGTKVAKLRMEQKRSQDFHHRAQGDVLTLQAGQRLSLTGDVPDADVGKEYACIRATHSFVNSNYGTGQGGDVASYRGDYTFVEHAKPYAPEMKTKLRVIEGPQTAKVVTKSAGQEIDCDEFGRILVHFHWDLDKRYSMRVRCAQMWAHNKWGSMFIPRVDMEVVVIFIDGNPERPLVVGCVYNGANDPPYKLPDKKNIAGIKSRSTQNGGPDNYNELYFDDTKGKELFNQQAEKDMKTLVKNDETRDVNNNRTTTIGKDETRTVKGKETHTINMNSTTTIKMNETRTVKLNRKTDVKVNETLKVGAMTKMQSTAMHEIKVGASKITLTPASIEIKSPMITINASGMLIAKGAMVFIN